MKTCFKCGVAKDLSEFYRHNEMADGHLGKCKDCTKRDVTENRNRNLKRIREYDRMRARTKKHADRNRKWAIDNPEKVRAQQYLHNWTARGKIKKPDICELCGEKPLRIVGHHTDYSKPLDVMWLCDRCHRNWHVKNGSVGV